MNKRGMVLVEVLGLILILTSTIVVRADEVSGKGNVVVTSEFIVDEDKNNDGAGDKTGISFGNSPSYLNTLKGASKEYHGARSHWGCTDFIKNEVMINTGTYKFGLHYNVCADSKYGGNGIMRPGPDHAVLCSMVGWVKPDRGGCDGWQRKGFFDVYVGKDHLGWYTGGRKGDFKVIKEGKDEGIVEISWSLPKADVKVYFIAKSDDNKVFMTVTVFPKKPFDRLAVQFIAIPQLESIEPKAVTTPMRRIVAPEEKVSLVLDKEDWLIYETDNPRAEEYHRAIGLMWLKDEPNEVWFPQTAKKGRDTSTWNRIVYTNFEYPLSTRRMHFIIFDYPGKTNEKFLDLLKTWHSVYSEELKGIAERKMKRVLASTNN